ncbi:arsenate reductase [Snodgrassella sp. CFCC 13594]|uniref:arsenate reductase n=1 Tax=Snodgrassella sp. CFCC 13594 TaxID=1775559 RepID=UPI000830B546|nr:arsenate reductase [Snodgrassella sp. CFCC 13594]
MTHIYGIANCNTVKKARTWLVEHHIEVKFIDFKKEPPSAALLHRWLKVVPCSVLINRKGTTWRKLSPEEQQQATNESGALALMQAHPSLIKRPVLVTDQHTEVGFDETRYAQIFQQQ